MAWRRVHHNCDRMAKGGSSHPVKAPEEPPYLWALEWTNPTPAFPVPNFGGAAGTGQATRGRQTGAYPQAVTRSSRLVVEEHPMTFDWLLGHADAQSGIPAGHL